MESKWIRHIDENNDTKHGGSTTIGISFVGSKYAAMNNPQKFFSTWMKNFISMYRYIVFALIFCGTSKNSGEVSKLLIITKILCIGSLIIDLLKCIMKNFAFNNREKVSNFYIKIFITNLFAFFLGFLIWKIYGSNARKFIYASHYCILGSLLVEILLGILLDQLFDFYILAGGFILIVLSAVMLLCDIEKRELENNLFGIIYLIYTIIDLVMMAVKKSEKIGQGAKTIELLIGIVCTTFFMYGCWIGLNNCLSSKEASDLMFKFDT